MTQSRTKVYVLAVIAFVLLGGTLAWYMGWIFSETSTEGNDSTTNKDNDNATNKDNDSITNNESTLNKDNESNTNKDNESNTNKDNTNKDNESNTNKDNESTIDNIKAYEFYKDERKDIEVLSKEYFEYALAALEAICEGIDKRGKDILLNNFILPNMIEKTHFIEQLIRNNKEVLENLFRSGKYELYLKRDSPLFDFQVQNDKIIVDKNFIKEYVLNEELFKKIDQEVGDFVPKDIEKVIFEKNIGEGPKYSLAYIMAYHLGTFIFPNIIY